MVRVLLARRIKLIEETGAAGAVVAQAGILEVATTDVADLLFSHLPKPSEACLVY
jgi:hypothetical protein